MSKSLRSILGKSNRVTKPRPSPPKRPSSATVRRQLSRSSSSKKDLKDEGDDDDIPQEKLDDCGISAAIAADLTLRDVIQAMRYVRNHMFTPVPERGFSSTRMADVLNYRVSMPPIVTKGHLNAVLRSPTKVEREMVELIGKGALRRVRIERRGGTGEALIEMGDLEAMVHKTTLLSKVTKEQFIEFLKNSPTSQTVARGMVGDAQTDELVRAGFLTSLTSAVPGSTLHVRPEDRTTLTSIDHVSRFGSGTVSAVGGGGGGGGRTGGLSTPADTPAFRLSIPGHGRYLKLAAGAVNWIREMLAKTRWGEAPESWLRERFEGGQQLYSTRWKQFWGVEWEWVLGEAVGLGVVEVFETGSVGRGVRALGG